MAERIDALLRFLPAMESRLAGEWKGGDENADGTITMPWFNYSETTLAFIEACYEREWVEPFDWGAWQGEAVKYYENPELLRTCRLGTLQKLLTLHLRKDRFSEGHLGTMIEEGHMAAILRRLETIRGRLS